MDDSRFPGSLIQDPILLDNERNRLSDQLQTTVGSLSKPIEKLALLLSGLRGNVIFSYPCYDLNDDSEKFPSPVLLSVYRIISGDLHGDQSDFSKWLSFPLSFSPSSPEKSLSRIEWWINRLSQNTTISNMNEIIPQYFPNIARGIEAKRARESDDFTEYDGYVPEAGADYDPVSSDGPELSAQRLETLGKNPLEFFFKYILEIEHTEEYKYDPNIWLDPLHKGNLLHRVFYEFMTDIHKVDRIPNLETDHKRIELILNKQIEYYKARYIPPNRDIFDKELNELEQAIRIFLCEEHEHCKNNRPSYFEVAIGTKTEGEGLPVRAH
jgi:ATP-dependent helicase/nuclease subunit B